MELSGKYTVTFDAKFVADEIGCGGRVEYQLSFKAFLLFLLLLFASIYLF